MKPPKITHKVLTLRYFTPLPCNNGRYLVNLCTSNAQNGRFPSVLHGILASVRGGAKNLGFRVCLVSVREQLRHTFLLHNPFCRSSTIHNISCYPGVREERMKTGKGGLFMIALEEGDVRRWRERRESGWRADSRREVGRDIGEGGTGAGPGMGAGTATSGCFPAGRCRVRVRHGQVRCCLRRVGRLPSLTEKQPCGEIQAEQSGCDCPVNMFTFVDRETTIG